MTGVMLECASSSGRAGDARRKRRARIPRVEPVRDRLDDALGVAMRSKCKSRALQAVRTV